jgi:hypothetical protein
MRGFAALAGNLALLDPIHRRKSAIFLGHCSSPPPVPRECRRRFMDRFDDSPHHNPSSDNFATQVPDSVWNYLI